MKEIDLPKEAAKVCYDKFYDIVKSKKKAKLCCAFCIGELLDESKEFLKLSDYKFDLKHKAEFNISILNQALKEIEKI